MKIPKSLRRVALITYRILLHVGFPLRIGAYGERFHVRAFHADRMTLHARHEPWLDPVYEAVLNMRPGLFVDVGVNTGQALLKVLSIDRARPYVGFEPQVDCAQFVSQFILDNALVDHVVFPVGLGESLTVAGLHLRDEIADSSASLVRGFRPDDFYDHHRSVLTVRGDDVLDALDYSSVVCVKIDVEGGELEVLRGLSRVLRDHHPVVMFEVLNHYLAITRAALVKENQDFRDQRIRQLEDVFRSHGYYILHVLPGARLSHVERIDPIVSADRQITDYVAIHPEDFEAFAKAWHGQPLAPVMVPE
jgi:FkbM family methyltransferase